MDRDTPILFLIFNRPVHTKRVFDTIRIIQPRYLFVAADGPRSNVLDDKEKCLQTRSIINQIDWDCRVHTLFREKNMGVKLAVSSAITWFFETNSEGIILEDDCLPDTSFYTFASALLRYYREDKTIMHINGTCYLKNRNVIKEGSYYFSNLCHPWGWATWKRSWENFDLAMTGFEEFNKNKLLSFMSSNSNYIQYWIDCLNKAYRGEISSWDYIWYYAVWKNRGIAITPVKNLVTNIGFGPEGTFTRYSYTKIGNLPRNSIEKIIHPKKKEINIRGDNISLKLRYREAHPGWMDAVKQKLKMSMFLY